MIEEDTVLQILALGLDNDTPMHRIEYLLMKLYGKDGLSLDTPNTIFYNKIKKVSEECR